MKISKVMAELIDEIGAITPPDFSPFDDDWNELDRLHKTIVAAENVGDKNMLTEASRLYREEAQRIVEASSPSLHVNADEILGLFERPRMGGRQSSAQKQNSQA